MHTWGRPHRRALGYLRPDGYGTVLLLIVGSILLLAVASDISDLVRVIWLALTGCCLLFALRASGARWRALAAGAALGGAALLISSVIHVFGARALALMFDNAAGALLLLAAAVAIGRRLAQHPVIAASTVFGAVCVYLLVGMLFAALFALLGVLEGGNFFGLATRTTTIDYLYFSFSTLTTVGDGTLTPQGNLARMLAVSEAVAGQLYLVTVIAFLAANFGRAARRPESDRARSGG